MCRPSAAAHRRVSRSPRLTPSGPLPEENHPENAQGHRNEYSPRGPQTEEEAVRQRSEDHEEPGYEPRVRGAGEEQSRGLKEVAQSQSEPYTRAHTQSS